MQIHATGQPVLGELRQHVLAPLLGSPLFSEAEQLRVNHSVHECEDLARLTRWYANVLAEITRRAAARQRCYYVAHATLRRLRPSSFRGHHPRQRQPAPTWVSGACLPECPDRHASTFRLAGARFQAAHTLSYAQLLCR